MLLEGFWFSNNYKDNYEHASIPIIVDVDLKDPIILPYCGPKSLQPFVRIALQTRLSRTCLLGILFLCDFQISKFILSRWVGLKVTL